MPKIITVHSFRRGTGKSIIAANLAAMLAMAGQRVGLLDADVLSPSLHWLLGLGQTEIDGTLTDFLLDQRSIEQTAHAVTSRLSAGAKGQLFLIPASDDALRIAHLLRDRYESDRLGEGCQHLIDQLALDVLVVDTHAGLNQDSLAAMAMSDVLLIVLRLDQQDYQGTAVTIDVARRLGIPALSLIVNQAPGSFQPQTIIAQLEQTYHCPVAGLLPLSEDLMVQPEAGLFVLDHARHPITTALARVAAQFGA